MFKSVVLPAPDGPTTTTSSPRSIAYIPAKYGMNVIDSGVAVLSMHAPWEVTSKADIYEAFKGYEAFLKNA